MKRAQETTSELKRAQETISELRRAQENTNKQATSSPSSSPRTRFKTISSKVSLSGNTLSRIKRGMSIKNLLRKVDTRTRQDMVEYQEKMVLADEEAKSK